MSCDAYSGQIPLYVYGELAPEAEEQFEQHFSRCAGCTEALDQYRRIVSAVDGARLEPPANLLAECRQGLSRAIHAEARKDGAAGASWWSHQLRALLQADIGFRVPVGAMALIAAGFLAARLLPDGIGRAGQASLTNVRSLQTDSSGRIHIGVADTQQKTVSGNVDDTNIRKLLIDALHDASNDGLRVESADMLKDHCALADVRNALTDRLLHDPSVGVRMAAIKGLKAFAADPEVRQALTDVLVQDGSPGVRIQAIELLAPQRDRALIGPLQTAMQKEDNPYVRLTARNALEDMHASPGTF